MFVLITSQLLAFFVFVSNHGGIQYWTTCFLLRIVLEERNVMIIC